MGFENFQGAWHLGWSDVFIGIPQIGEADGPAAVDEDFFYLDNNDALGRLLVQSETAA